MHDNFVSANNKVASEYNHILTQLIDLLEEEPPPAAVKVGLDFINLYGGTPRKPLLPATENLKERVKIKSLKFKVLK